jgi:hypothetical protein
LRVSLSSTADACVGAPKASQPLLEVVLDAGTFGEMGTYWGYRLRFIVSTNSDLRAARSLRFALS